MHGHIKLTSHLPKNENLSNTIYSLKIKTCHDQICITLSHKRWVLDAYDFVYHKCLLYPPYNKQITVILKPLNQIENDNYL